MASKKISELQTLITLDSNADVFPVVDISGLTTHKISSTSLITQTVSTLPTLTTYTNTDTIPVINSGVLKAITVPNLLQNTIPRIAATNNNIAIFNGIAGDLKNSNLYILTNDLYNIEDIHYKDGSRLSDKLLGIDNNILDTIDLLKRYTPKTYFLGGLS